MLIIRQKQMDTFREAALARFTNETVKHISEFTPAHFEALGYAAIREIVTMAIDRAKGYGLTKRGPVILFVEMMFLFGSFFDKDPQYPWIEEILSETDEICQEEIADKLYHNTADYLDNVSCLEYQQRALERLSSTNLKAIPKVKEDDRGFFLNEMAMCLHRIYPEKYEFSGEDAIRGLIQNVIKSAEYHLPSVSWGPALFSTMSFFLGHKCFSDPQFPWIQETFDNDIFDKQQIADFVYSKMKEHIKVAMLQ